MPKLLKGGRALVSANFVIPYPPGFPVLVPGQVISPEILVFLIAIDVKEIHGFRAELGLRVFTDGALDRKRTGTALGGALAAARSMGNGSSGAKKERKG